MLILSRKPGETIRICDDIEVTVLRVAGHQVRLGINAPKDVNIVREEIAGMSPKESVYKHRAYGVKSDGSIGA